MSRMQAVSSAQGLPDGTVTLLFTDIEGSTERWERHRDAMRSALERHDSAMRASIEANGGEVFKTAGDAFCAVFRTASEAVASAVEAQQAIAREDWHDVEGIRVRMAIHTGPVDLRGKDYFGPTVNRVARLLGIGHGGQVLVSGVAKELAEDTMPPQATLRDLGAHRLKDLTHPEQVYQLIAPGLSSDFPALRSLESLPNNLPLQLTNFIGREDEVSEVETLLDTSRLVTLVGAGGVGKTRLSLQVGAEVLDRYQDGVWFIDFATVSDADLVTATVANVFSLRPQGDRPLLETVVGALKNRNALLIFDNCEHVVAAAARLADAILHGCPKVSILASSREGLGIEGETVERVPSLGLPPEDASLTAQSAMKYAAIALFNERAMAANRRFALTDQNVAMVADICRQLDGIALAIELAAPRINVLSLDQLAARLNERFRILTGGRRTALPRQQTMRALIDWSYDLLTENEKVVFARASLFAGSFSLDAASDICSDAGIESWDVLDVLSSLVNKSLLHVELAGSEQRFRMLVSTRQYALERLNESGELATLQRAHAQWYLKFAEDMDRVYFKTPTRRWLAQLDPEWENLRAAIDWAFAADPQIGLDLMNALTWAWMQGSRASEGVVRLPQALALAGDDEIRVRLLFAYGYVASYAGLYRVQRTAGEEGLELARSLDDREGIALSLLGISGAAFTDPSYDFESALLEAKGIFEELGNKRAAGFCTFVHARSSNVLSNDPAARGLYEESLRIARATGDERTVMMILNNLGEVEFRSGNVDAAIKSVTESQEYASGLRDVPTGATNHLNLAAYLIKSGDHAAALAAVQKASRLCRDAQLSFLQQMTALHFGAIAALNGDLERAGRLAGRAIAAYAEAGNSVEPTEQWLHDTIRTRVDEALGEARYDALAAEGAQMTAEAFATETSAVTLDVNRDA